MAELDWSVGQVLAKLRELDLQERTLVLFTSDNGLWYGGSTGGLRGMKNTSWEGGVRVPLIAYWPGQIPAGQVRSEPSSLLDLYPTVLAACDVPAPQDRVLDGENLLPLLKGEASEVPPRTLLIMWGAYFMAVRSGPWKLHVKPPPSFERGPDWVDPWAPDGVQVLAPCQQPGTDQHPGLQSGDPAAERMLFHLEEDPAEQNNVASRRSEIVQRLQLLMEGSQKASREKPASSPERGPEDPRRRSTFCTLPPDITLPAPGKREEVVGGIRQAG